MKQHQEPVGSHDYLYFQSSYDSLLENSEQSISVNRNQILFNKVLCTSDSSIITFDTSLSRSQTRFQFDKNHLNIDENFEDFSIEYSNSHFNFTLGNNYQSIGYNSLVSGLIYRDSSTIDLTLDIQNELDDPLDGQLLFRHKYKEDKIGIYLSYDNFELNIHTIEDSDASYGLSLGFDDKNSASHQLTFQKAEISQPAIQLEDPHYDYGQLNWSNEYSFWLLENNFRSDDNKTWSINFIHQDFSFQSTGGVSFADLVGQSANIVGANWFWGIQGSFKASGLSVYRTWKNQQWRHSFGSHLNKVTPLLNTKLYKSLILIGIPSLEEEDTLDIEYAYISQLAWRSSYQWNDFLFSYSIKQLVPIYTKESQGSETSTSTSSKSNSPYKHSGFSLSGSISYSF